MFAFDSIKEFHNCNTDLLYIREKRGVGVGFFDFFRSKKVVEKTKIKTNNSYDNETGIKIGQKIIV